MSNNFNEKLDQALELLKGQDIAGAEKVFDERINCPLGSTTTFFKSAIPAVTISKRSSKE